MFKCSISTCFRLSLFDPIGCKIETSRQQSKFQRDHRLSQIFDAAYLNRVSILKFPHQ